MRSTHTTYHSLVDCFIIFGDEHTLRSSAVFTNWKDEWQKKIFTHVKIIGYVCVCVCVCDWVSEINGTNWIKNKVDCKGGSNTAPRHV